MKYNKLTRRHFLQGVGGSFLSLPFLPSLMSSAEAATLPERKFLVIFWSAHGGMQIQNLYPIISNPAVASKLTTQTLYSSVNHTAKYGNLVNLKTTMGSNTPYLATMLGNDLPGDTGILPSANAYGVNTLGQDFDAGAARVSPVLGNFISDAHLAKINLISGLDFMHDSGHGGQQTGNFCNYAGNSAGNPTGSKEGMPNVWIPTIDSVAAKYPNFYAGANPVVKSMALNIHWHGIDAVDGNLSADVIDGVFRGNPNRPDTLGKAFNILFSSLKSAQADPAGSSKKSFLLNNVYEDYARVARGAYGPGRRIGKEDRSRLEQFMETLNSVILGMTTNAPGACTIPGISATDTSIVTSGGWGLPIDLTVTRNTLHLYNQLMTAAFSCGLTNIFVVGLPALRDQFIPFETFKDQGVLANGFAIDNRDAHQGMFHCHNLYDRARYLTQSMRWYFQYGFYDLMQKLEAATLTSGGSILDQSLLFWTQECGHKTHSGANIPIITAGSAGGFFKTGQFVDYKTPNRKLFTKYGNLNTYQGLSYNRFLATVLQSMGLPTSAYEVDAAKYAGTLGRMPVSSTNTVKGYGHPVQHPFKLNSGWDPVTFVYDYQLDDLSLPLPIIT
ncbi:MAG: DUF1552 domain-containing protein [Pseudobdellovibrionaceae bacterium]